MRYSSASAFAAALTAHLQHRAGETGLDFNRLHKAVAFERLLARLVDVAPDRFLLKGGVALEYRLSAPLARATQDLDISTQATLDDFTGTLRTATRLDLHDFFRFSVDSEPQPVVDGVNAYRFRLRVHLGGRRFEDLRLDVGFSDPPIVTAEIVTAPALLGFANVPPPRIPTIPAEYHIADKLHAYTRRHGLHGEIESSRVKDLIDLALIASYAMIRGSKLRTAIERVYASHPADCAPNHFPEPPASWATPYKRLAETLAVAKTLDAAHAYVGTMLAPVLERPELVRGQTWSPRTHRWSVARERKADELELDR